jgi:hypothetical protein
VAQPLTDAVRSHLLDEHRDYLSAVLARAHETGPDADALRARLAAAGLLARAPGVLADCVTAAGRDLPFAPVAAPPYVVVTTEGLVLRATLDDGRLVVRLAAHAYDRAAGAWRRGGDTPEAALDVSVR